MKKYLLSLSLLTILINISSLTAQTTWVTTSCAGSPTVTQVVINACGTEGMTEFFNFETGTSSFDINTLSATGSSLYTVPPLPLSGTTPAGNPLASGFTSQGAAATAVIAYLNGLTGGCSPSPFVAVPASGIIPPNSKVIAFPSSGPINTIGTPSLAAYCGQTVYVIVGNYAPTLMGAAGFYTNSPSSASTLTITMGGCVYTITYGSSVSGDGGNITNAGGGIGMINAGTGDCFPPPPLNCTVPTATASNTISPTVLCVGATNQTINLSVTTNASPATYAWSGPNSFTSTQQNPTITNAALPLGTHTYTVTVTGAGGCTKTSTTQVIVKATPSGTPSQTGLLCGNTSPYSGSITLGATGGTNYAWSTGQTGFVTTVPVTQPGSYGVTVTNTAGCSVERTFNVTATPAPTPAITAPATLCPTEAYSLSLNTTFNTYAWSGGGTGATKPITGPGTYSVTVTNAAGCTGVASVTITATTALTPIITAPTSLCPTEAATLSLNAAYNTYAWSGGGILSTKPINGPGIYTVTVTSSGGCTGTASVTITASPALLPSINAPATLCPTETATLSLNGGPYVSSIWSSGSSNIVGPGSYTVTVTNAGGCTGTANVVIGTTTGLNPTINAPASLCVGGNGTLTLSSMYSSYLWSGGSLTNTQAITGPGTYSVTVTNNSGCSGSTTITVPSATPPTPTINAPATLCAGALTSLTLNGGPYTSHAWSGGTTPSLAITNITGSGTYSVTVTNSAGCKGVASVIILPGASLTPTIAPHGKICGLGSINLSVSAIYSSYLWSAGSNGGTQNVTSANTYTVTVTDAAGCTGIASTIVQQVTSPAVNITGITNICQGASTTLTATSANTITTYAWTPSGSSNTINVTTAGNYSITVTDNNGCTALSSVAVGNFPNPTVSFSGDQVVCIGAMTSVSASVTDPLATYIWSDSQTGSLVSLGKGTHTVTATDANGCKGIGTRVITEDIPTTNITGNLTICPGAMTTLNYTGSFVLSSWSNGSGTPTITVGAGTHSVTVTNANGCQAKNTVTVTALAQPTVTITGSASFCAGSTNVLATNPTFASYVWSDQTTGASISPSVTGTYKVTVTDANGCKATDTKNVNQFPNPTPNISGSTTICAGSSTTLGVGNYSSYIWSNGATTQTTLVNQQGTIGVTVTDINGCRGTDSKNITSSAALVFPITGIPSFCEGKTTTLSAGAGFSSYLWSTNETTSSITVNTDKTYTVTVTSGVCSGTASIVVTKKSTPTFTFTGNTPFCQGASIVLGTNPTFSAYSWSGGGLNSTLTVTQSGSYTVTVTDANGCIGQQSVVAVVNQNPIPAISGSTSLCLGDSTKLSVTQPFSSYIWSNSKTTSSIFAKAIQNYSVTVTDANGCKGVAVITVNKATDLKPFLSGKKEFCEGGSVELSVAAGFGKYEWSNGKNTEKITVTKGGTYIVTVSNGACKGVDSAFVMMNLKPVIVLTKDTAVCEGTSVSLTANVNALSYKWSNQKFGETITVNKSGTYIVTVTTVEGCVSRDSVKVTVNPLPKPVVFAPSTICVGEEAILALTEKYATYLWSENKKTSDTIRVKIPDTYYVTVTTAAGCTGVASKKIDVKANLSPSILGNLEICSNGNTTLSLDGNYASYKWSDGTTASTLLVNKTGTYSVTVSSAAGCTGETSVVVQQAASPSPVIKGSLFICGSTPTLLDAGAGFETYLWSNNEKGQKTEATSAGIYSVTVTNKAGCTGTTTVTLQEATVTGTLKDTLCKGGSRVINGKKYDETNATGIETLLKAAKGGCDSILTIQLYFRPEISVNLSGGKTVCSNQNTDLTLDVKGYNGTFDLVYEDDLGVKTPVNGVKNGDKITLNPSKTTNYTIISTTIPNGTCGVTLGSAKITIGSLTYTAKVTDISCNGQKDGSVIVSPTSGTAPYSFDWSNGIKVADNVTITAGKYTVTISDAGGCSAVKTYDIIEPELIQGEIIGEGVSCKGNAGQIIIKKITGGSGNYSYSLDGKIFSAVGGLPFTLPNIAAGDYTVIINDGNKCTWSQKLNIAASATRKVDLGLDITLNYGDSVVLTPKADFLMTKIIWTPKAYMTCNDNTCQFPSVKPKATTIYRVVVTDVNGCTATDDVAIFVNKVRRVYIPSAFSPGNSDGYNDLFRVYLGDETVKVNWFRVFDRWGNMVYEDIDFSRAESQNINRGWNGVFRGDALDPSVFTYHVQVEFTDGEVKDYKGDVMLVRY